MTHLLDTRLKAQVLAAKPGKISVTGKYMYGSSNLFGLERIKNIYIYITIAEFMDPATDN